MDAINYFKLQAKNLFRDFKTQKKAYFGTSKEDYIYEYSPNFFDIDGLILYLDLNENKFSLMKAQHVIAQIAGFNKWNDLIKANSPDLNLAKIVFENQNILHPESWDMYIKDVELMNQTKLDSLSKINIYKKVFLSDPNFKDSFDGYILKLN